MNRERNTQGRNGTGAEAERLTPEQGQFVKGAEYAMGMIRDAATVYCGAMREDGLPRHSALLDERVNDVADFIIRYLTHGLDGVVTDMIDLNAMEAEDGARAGEDRGETAHDATAEQQPPAGDAEEAPHDTRDAEETSRDARGGEERDVEDLAAQIESLLKEEAELGARLAELERPRGASGPGGAAGPGPGAEEEGPGKGEAEAPHAEGTDAEDGESATDATATEDADHEPDHE